MKKFISIICLFLFVTNLFSQTTSENYILSKTYLEAVNTSNSTAKSIKSIQYIDGLGRPKQIVGIEASPTQKDVVVHIEYDQFGRQTKDYLPIPQSGTQNGDYYASPLANASNIYGAEKIYSESILEISPLDRIKQKIQVGNDWVSHPIQFDYGTNEDDIIKFNAITTWNNGITESNLVFSGTYQGNLLYKDKITDEDGNVTELFTNKKGQKLLIRRKLNLTENIDTYYIYDIYDHLCYVIQPKAIVPIQNLSINSDVTANIKNELCYQYKYDDKDRLVEKKLPGKGWEYMVYDKADRLIMTQDANQRIGGTWLFTKYDQFGRVAFTGITLANTNSTRTIEQTAANNISINNVMRTANAVINYSSLDLYYTVADTYPHYTNISHLLSVNYYDTYPPLPSSLTIPTNIIGQNVLTQDAIGSPISTKSLPTASFVKNIEDNGWTKAYTWYDTKGRPIGSHSINHLGGYTKTQTELDFAGVVKQSNITHKKLDTDSPTLVHEEFTYDNQSRMLTHKHKVGNNPLETLSTNAYNELSQIIQKGVGGSTGTPLQTVDYIYNIRGWMTGINDPTNLGADLFGYKIKYNQVEGLQIPDASDNTLQVLPKYNGNIAEVDWKTSLWENEPLERYGYVYDSLDRLKAGFYQESSNPSLATYYEKVGYDINGNIKNLKRTAGNYGPTAMVIDNLNYQYNSNDLSNKTQLISDYSQNNKGYPAVTTPTPIQYDANGNTTSFADKGISSISYNFLNLPQTIIQGNNSTNFTYSANGIKLKKVFAGRETYYLDGFQYAYTDPYDDPTGSMVNAETILRVIPTNEGYFDPLLNKYFYNFLDQVGNVRLTYSDADGNGAVAGNTRVTQCYGTLPNEMCIDYFISGEINLVNKYYPFGLLHDYQFDYNIPYNYKFQGQELQETGLYSFKWRNYMPDVGRFFNVDPLSEKYAYQSHYNFSENRVVDGVELEGLEFNSINEYQDFVNRNPEYSLSFDGEFPVLTGSGDIEGVVIQGKSSINNILAEGNSDNFDYISFAETASDFIPFVGSGKDIYQGINNGDWVQFSIGIAGLGLDIATAGTGSLVKGGLKTVGKAAARELAENAAEFAVKEAAGEAFTKSSMKLGREVHSYYKAGFADKITRFKEFRDVPGVRPDYVDFGTNTIYELKPFNKNGAKSGAKQLKKYKREFEKFYPGTTWSTVLDHY